MHSLTGALGLVFLPVQRLTTTVLAASDAPENEKKLAQAAQIIQSEEDKKEMQALRDQFDTKSVSAQNLTPSEVVGYGGYIPGASSARTLVIDKGSADGLKKGQAVVYKDNLVGVITKVSMHSSLVTLLGAKDLSFTATTSSADASGVVKGFEDGLVMDNIVLSEKIEKGDLVVTKGDMTLEGTGFPPGLVIGQVEKSEKKQSDIFQKAYLKSLLDFNSLRTVFVINS